MKLPVHKEFTASWGRRFIKHLGGDPSPIENHWCWDEFYKQYGQDDELMKRVLTYFKKMKCAEAAYNITYRMPKHREWAEKVIKLAGNAELAFMMVQYCGSSREWAEKIIEKAGDGHLACRMFRFCNSSREWAEKVIEESGDVVCAEFMVQYYGSTREWYDNLFEK